LPLDDDDDEEDNTYNRVMMSKMEMPLQRKRMINTKRKIIMFLRKSMK
jgi:hypothetical protein